MDHIEVEISEKRFKELIEATEKHNGKLSKEKKEKMRENYFKLNKEYKIKNAK